MLKIFRIFLKNTIKNYIFCNSGSRDAIAGGTISVPLLNGEKCNFPFGPLRSTTAPKRLKEKGMPISKNPGTFGDLLGKFELSLPKGSARHKVRVRKTNIFFENSKHFTKFSKQKWCIFVVLAVFLGGF